MLTKLKKALAEAEAKAASAKKDKANKLASLNKKQQDIEKTEKAIYDINEKHRELKQMVTNKKDMPEPLNFVKQRNDCVKEARENKDWKRKIEIAEFEAKKARAIIRKPTICLLDEATSALDSKAESVVQAALDQMIGQNAAGCTIMIAHRLSTVKNCDTILALDKGHVVEKGTHSELLEIEIEKDGNGKTIRGLYRELWETQHGGVSVEQANKAREKEAAHVAEVARLTKEIEKLHKKLSADTKSERESIDLTRTPSEQSSMSDLDEGSEKEE